MGLSLLCAGLDEVTARQVREANADLLYMIESTIEVGGPFTHVKEGIDWDNCVMVGSLPRYAGSDFWIGWLGVWRRYGNGTWRGISQCRSVSPSLIARPSP